MNIEQLLEGAGKLSDDDVLGQILSSRIDFGSEGGGLVSARQFPSLIADIKAWQVWREAMPVNTGSAAVPDAAAARAALDSLDDFARMDTGVDAIGPRATLLAYIEKTEAAFRCQKLG